VKNTVRAVLVAVLAIPALTYSQVPAAPQVPSTAAVKDAGVKKTGAVGATVAPHAHGAAATSVDKGVEKAAGKAGIK
jgi:hypothetical protein